MVKVDSAKQKMQSTVDSTLQRFCKLVLKSLLLKTCLSFLREKREVWVGFFYIKKNAEIGFLFGVRRFCMLYLKKITLLQAKNEKLEFSP